MKILWLSHDSNMSGANICLDEFLQIMHQQKVENHLIVPRDGKMMELAKDKTAAIHQVKFYSWNWPLNSTPPISFRLRRLVRNRKAVHDIERIIKKIKPDFVVSNTVVTPVAALAAKRSGTKHIWFIHEFGEEDHGYTIGGGFKNAAKKMNRLSHKMVFISKAVEKKYEGFVPSAKRNIVHNAMLRPPVVAQNFSSNGHVKAMMLGQIAPSKNQLEALHAIKISKEAGVNVHLHIYGKCDDDNYMQTLKSFLKAEDLNNSVSFMGTTNTPEATIAQHDLLLMCSRKEAFGRVTVEALKCGVPVIAANAGGSGEIVTDQHDGYLYEAGNAADLSKKIQAFVVNKASFDRKQISNKAISKYNAEVTLQQLKNVFH